MKEIKGVIYFDAKEKRYSFIQGVDKSFFKDGVYTSEWASWVFVKEHVIEFEIPKNLDLIAPQLNALDAQEENLTVKYNMALNHINVQRNNLLAIEG